MNFFHISLRDSMLGLILLKYLRRQNAWEYGFDQAPSDTANDGEILD